MCEESALDFGLVSYGFLNSRLLHLHNTSEIAMKVKLRIEEDDARGAASREFRVIWLTEQSQRPRAT